MENLVEVSEETVLELAERVCKYYSVSLEEASQGGAALGALLVDMYDEYAWSASPGNTPVLIWESGEFDWPTIISNDTVITNWLSRLELFAEPVNNFVLAVYPI